MQIREQISKISDSPVFWILAFAICISPLALNYIIHHVDEMHYTDAAIQMLRTHDYFTPLKADGSPRFLKPVFSYWMIVCSYKIFGISQFSSRMPFFICGLLLLWITYRMTLKLTQNKSTSLIALLIIATNPLLVLSSSRSMPDMPQALFFSIAVLGLIGIFKSEKPTKKDLWLFYMGFSFAFATKGIPAVVFLILSLVFLLFNSWKKYKLSELIHWPAVLTGLIVALSWLILMYIVHENKFFFSFFYDQLGGRITEDRFRVLRNIATALLAIIGYFGVFIFPIVSLKIKTAFKNEKLSVHFLLFIGITLMWLIAMFVFSVFSVKFYDRYFLPVFPLIAVLVAILFQTFTGNNTIRYVSISRTVVVLLGVLLTSISLVLSLRLDLFSFSVIYIVLLILFIVLMFAFRKQESLPNEFKKLTGLILLIFMSGTLFVSTFSFPDQGTQIAGYLNARYKKGQKIVFYGQPKVAAKLNVSTSGDFDICCIKPTYIGSKLLTDSIIIYRQELPPVINIEKYTIESIADEWKTIPVISLILGEKTDFINKNYHTIYMISAIR